jgi:hypothetical protein
VYRCPFIPDLLDPTALNILPHALDPVEGLRSGLLTLGTLLFSFGYKNGWIIPTGDPKAIPAGDPTTKTVGRFGRIFNRFIPTDDPTPRSQISLSKWPPFTSSPREQSTRDFYPYKPFSGIVYSLETLLPFVDLYQAKHWVPNAESGGGRVLRGYLWFHTLLGWFFASMIVAGLSGVVQK